MEVSPYSNGSFISRSYLNGCLVTSCGYGDELQKLSSLGGVSLLPVSIFFKRGLTCDRIGHVGSVVELLL